MTGRTIIARTCKQLAEALQKQGFVFVADLPPQTRIEIRRGMIVVRMP
ncbi:hypothetical protein HNO91_11980 [Pseudomonas corrugata]|uniref:Uncharacterized protein n=1 Tax=Pseudomonas corrugata TaxID=47879 RepID=A0A7Y6DHI2_9PSED|nr:hypothetical protein [Pseudomonas corrugata]MDU9039961.1 hypothetical protein [Pseudomonas corrugata]NUT87146.1 hypothetical protein [Pseudomonas corrugata]